MKRLYVPTTGPSSWRALLADPSLQWKREASAMELAISWEIAALTARGLPAEVSRVLDTCEWTRNARLLFAVPEHRVALPGGGRASQTDLWAVLGLDHGWASVSVEAKAREPFGPTISDWLREASPGKRMRLDALSATLGVPTIDTSELRYQLFHRAASAVLEASRIGARTAMLVVQNFYPASTAWPDFEAFVQLFNVSPCRDGVCEARCPRVERLLFAWVDCRVATDAELATVV